MKQNTWDESNPDTVINALARIENHAPQNAALLYAVLEYAPGLQIMASAR